MALLAMIHAPASAGEPVHYPVLLGVNMAGGYHMNSFPPKVLEYFTHEPFYKAMADLGVQFVDVMYLISNDTSSTQRQPEWPVGELARIDQGMRAHGLRYTLNTELQNWAVSYEITPGVNEFAQTDGIHRADDTHRWDLRPEWLTPVQAPQQSPSALLGIVYDEGEHMQLTGNAYCAPDGTFDAPYLANTTDLPLETGWSRLVDSCRRIREEHYQGRVRLMTEQVWPDLFHIYARAGWTVDPKILKENLSSVVMAIALGAALQYADAGADLWVCADLWNWDLYPGHSPEALHSALLMAYWLGASAIYVENLDYPYSIRRHPLADPRGSLLDWTSRDDYTITTHGRVVQDFYKQYVPAHPRPVTWRDYRPRVAIIRLPDGAWGQTDGIQPNRNRLLGNKTHPEDEISREWLKIWPILTHGVADPRAISTNNRLAYPGGVKDFFVPLDSVAVFDHTVTGPVLDSVDCFIVCGHALSKETFEDLSRRAAAGGTVIIARRLYALYATGALPGNWLIVDNFTDPAIAAKLKPFLGPPDVARFRFKDRTVELRHGTAPDSVTVQVNERTMANPGSLAME